MNWFIPVSVIAWALLLTIWYLCCGAAPFKKRGIRVLLGLGGVTVVIFALSSLLRYEGSASGSSFPKFSWIWENQPERKLPPSIEIVRGIAISPKELDSASGDLNQIFGPDRNAMWNEASFKTDWSTDSPRLVWRRPIGMGWSSFVVNGTRAITQEQDGDDECVTCINLSTGETEWQYKNEGVRLLLAKAEIPGAAMGGDGPRSTPVIHQDKIISLGSTGIVNCLKLETGELIWSRNVIEEFDGRLQEWGQANAPLVLSELGIVVIPGTAKTGVDLVAFNIKNGEDAWVHQGSGASFSSPRMMTFSGVSMIVCCNAQTATGHDPKTGKSLWTYEWPGNFPRVGQPQQVGENRILFTASYGMGSPLIEIQKAGTQWTVSEIWKSTRLKTKFSTAVIQGDQAVGLDEGRLASIHLATGSIRWKGDKYGFGQNLLFGNTLLIQSEAGAVVIGQLKPDGFTETGRIDDALSSMTWNAPAVAGRFLLIRNDKEAVCYLLPAR